MCGHRGWWPLTFPPMLVTLDGHHCFLGVSCPYPNLKPSLSCVLTSPEASWSHSVGLSLDESGGLSAPLWVCLSGSHWASLHVDLSRLCISLVHLSLWFLILCLCLFVSSSLSLVKTVGLGVRDPWACISLLSHTRASHLTSGPFSAL